MVDCFSHHGCLSFPETESTKPPPLTGSSPAIAPSHATISASVATITPALVPAFGAPQATNSSSSWAATATSGPGGFSSVGGASNVGGATSNSSTEGTNKGV